MVIALVKGSYVCDRPLCVAYGILLSNWNERNQADRALQLSLLKTIVKLGPDNVIVILESIYY